MAKQRPCLSEDLLAPFIERIVSEQTRVYGMDTGSSCIFEECLRPILNDMGGKVIDETKAVIMAALMRWRADYPHTFGMTSRQERGFIEHLTDAIDGMVR